MGLHIADATSNCAASVQILGEMMSVGSLLLLAAVGTVCGQSGTTVTVDGLGTLQGSTGRTAHGNRTFSQFLGVRYATVPTRFQAPFPEQKWNGTRDATAYGPACPQFMSLGGSSSSASERHPAVDVDPVLLAAAADRASESEDCLTMDIYTPNLKGKLPVLVYIHGGAFIGGSSRQVQPHFLLDYDLVLVAPQYRLGPLGFLSMQTDEAPGNAGLMDQLAALQWVHDHIAQFGGDPARVTLAGGSAGAASAALLHLSPLSYRSAELFQQVYLESGSALAPWSLEDDPVSRANEVAVVSGCILPGSRLECLRKANVSSLVTGFLWSALQDMLSGGTGLGSALPVVQTAGSIKVLEQKPLHALQANTYRGLPMLVGVTKHEGLLPLALLTIYKKVLDVRYNGTDFYKTKTVNDLVRRVMMIEENRVATDAVADKYFKPGTLDSIDAMEPSLIDLGGAVHFKGPALTTVEFNSKAGKRSYLYSFNHQDKKFFEAVSHCGDFAYLFPSATANLTAEEDSVSQKLVHLVANFVIHGNTTATAVPGVPSWRPYTLEDPSFLLVDKTPQLRQDFERQLTVAATEGLRKQVSAAAAASVASVATLLAAVVAALAVH